MHRSSWTDEPIGSPSRTVEGRSFRMLNGEEISGPQDTELNEPHGVYDHPDTRLLYVADSSNNRVLRIEHPHERFGATLLGEVTVSRFHSVNIHAN